MVDLTRPITHLDIEDRWQHAPHWRPERPSRFMIVTLTCFAGIVAGWVGFLVLA